MNAYLEDSPFVVFPLRRGLDGVILDAPFKHMMMGVGGTRLHTAHITLVSSKMHVVGRINAASFGCSLLETTLLLVSLIILRNLNNKLLVSLIRKSKHIRSRLQRLIRRLGYLILGLRHWDGNGYHVER